MDPAHLIERIERVDINNASVGELASVVGDLGRLKGWVGQTEAAAARRAGELEAAGQATSAADLIARGTKTSRRSAERAQKRGETLANTPEVDKQLGDGKISTDHADALSSAAGKLDDEQRSKLFERDAELAAKAAQQTPGQFSRTLAKTVREISDDDGIERSEQQRDEATLSHGINADTGMGWIRADLHPDHYQKVKTRLDAEINAMKRLAEYEGMSYSQLAAIALVGLVTGGRLKAQPPAAVSILIDFNTLVNGIHADTVSEYSDGTPVPPETVRRHACNANIIPIVLGSDGMPLDVGRGARHATPAQRHALRAMYRTCAVDRCERTFDSCEIHHMIEWLHLGDTDLENLLPLCTYHHHKVHEGRWRLQLDPSTRQLDVFYPDGSHHSSCVPDIIDERRGHQAA